MKSGWFIILILIITLTLIFFILPNKSLKENFNNIPPVPSFSSAVNERGDRYNSLASIVNPNIPTIEFTPDNNIITRQATATPIVSGQYQGELHVSEPQSNLRVPTKNTDLLEKIKICEAVKTTECSAFDNNEFNKYCGLSLDLDGTRYTGEKHVGGLYVDPSKKQNALARKPRPNPREFSPSFGTSKSGYFSLDKNSCLIMKESIECEQKKDYSSPNCVQCYTENTWARLDPDAVRSSPDIFVGGSGILQVGGSGNITLTEKPIKLNLSADNFKEGKKILMTITSYEIQEDVQGNKLAKKIPSRLFGYIESPILTGGKYSMDLVNLAKDTGSGLTPNFPRRTFDTPLINGQKLSIMGPRLQFQAGVGSTETNPMKVEITIPFSFIEVSDQDATLCKTGPILTMKSSGEFLKSSKCAMGQPGKYSLECLQEKFKDIGGLEIGTGYPSNNQKAAELLFVKNDGEARTLEDILDFLTDMMYKAKLGRDMNGNDITIQEWNYASKFMLGKEIDDPCGIYDPDTPVSQVSNACLNFIYRNEGQGKAFGSTYTSQKDFTSLLNKNKNKKALNTFCVPGAPLDPTTPQGRQNANERKNIQDVKILYDQSHRLATDNKKTILERKDAIKNCYNFDVEVPNTQEVFWVGPENSYLQFEAAEICNQFGSRMATKSEAKVAHNLGAKFCSSAWVGDSDYAIKIGCDGKQDIEEDEQAKNAAALCFGIKPTESNLGPDKDKYKFKPFSDNSWNSKEVFTVNGGACGIFGATVSPDPQLQMAKSMGFAATGESCYGVKPHIQGSKAANGAVAADFIAGKYSAYNVSLKSGKVQTDFGMALRQDAAIEFPGTEVAILFIVNNTVYYLTQRNNTVILSRSFDSVLSRFTIENRQMGNWENRFSTYIKMPNGNNLSVNQTNGSLTGVSVKGPSECFTLKNYSEKPYVLLLSYFQKYLTKKTDTTVLADGASPSKDSAWLLIDISTLNARNASLKTVKLYEHIDYQGKEWILPEGKYNKMDLEMYGIPANIISSAKVESGVLLKLYSGAEFNGTEVIIPSDAKNLFDNDFNDQTLSLIIERGTIEISLQNPADYIYEKVGCFRDTGDRAIPYNDVDGEYKNRGVNAINMCFERAVKAGHTIFSIQDLGQCFSMKKDDPSRYGKYGELPENQAYLGEKGRITGCVSSGLGGFWANSVYRIKPKPAPAPAPPPDVPPPVPAPDQKFDLVNYGKTWTPQEQNRNWFAVASSADGTKLVAAIWSTGKIYTSTDSGVTWTPREENRDWLGVASSADGRKLVAVGNQTKIYTSTDSGVSWTPRETYRGWRSVASSADGTKLVAVVWLGGQIYTSTDSGETWTPRGERRNWHGVASSADGTKLVAVVYGGGHIYTSSDSGVTWTQREQNRWWLGVASSADGSKLVASVHGGQIYTSTDSGVTWTPREQVRAWYNVASSADGSKLVAVAMKGQIYTSTDSGVTWTPREQNRVWQGVTSSADGSKLVAVDFGGKIYTSQA